MNEQKEKQVTQPFGPFFNLIFTIAMLISRLLHPVTVQGLEHLPRHGALLIANHASNWDPILLATALPRDYRLRVMGKEELFRNPIIAWVIRVGGAFPLFSTILRELPGNRSCSGATSRMIRRRSWTKPIGTSAPRSSVSASIASTWSGSTGACLVSARRSMTRPSISAAIAKANAIEKPT